MKNISVNKPELQALYLKIGGEPGLEKILKSFYRKMSNDVMLGFFFSGKNTDEIAIKQKFFLMKAMGASTSYSGKPPATAHEAMPPILAGHFDRRLRLLEETLREYGLPLEDIRTWVEFESAFRSGVVSA